MHIDSASLGRSSPVTAAFDGLIKKKISEYDQEIPQSHTHC